MPTPETMFWQKASAKKSTEASVRHHQNLAFLLQKTMDILTHLKNNKYYDFNSHIMNMIEIFKEDINKSLKETQKNTIKQVETLKEETNPLKKYRKIQLNK